MKDILLEFIMTHSNLFTSMNTTPEGFIEFLEGEFLNKIIDAVGYEWAVRIEDMIVLLTTFLFSLGVAFFLVTPLILKGPFDYSIRFSEKLNEVVYTFVEHNGYKELVLRKPKSFWERIELGIALVYVGINGEKRPVKTKNVRAVTILCVITFAILLLLMILFVLFTLNVVIYDGLTS